MEKMSVNDLLSKIEIEGGPSNTNLSEKEFVKLDLSRTAIESLRSEKEGQAVWWSTWTLGMNLEGAFLYRSVFELTDLTCADLRKADLRRCKFISSILTGADLVGANLEETSFIKANLAGANLSRVNLMVAAGLEGVFWCGAILDHTRVMQSQLGNEIGEEIEKSYEKAREAYVGLKNNFRTIGRYDDAAWAYVKERRMERNTHRPTLARKYYAKEIERLPRVHVFRLWQLGAFYVRHCLRYLRDYLFEVSSEYGENIGRFLLFACLLLSLLTVGLWVTQGVGIGDKISHRFGDYVLFTFATFVKTSLPNLEAVTGPARLLKAVDGATGISIFALIMFMLGRKISRT